MAANVSRQYSLFTDRRNHRLDDVITVVIDEQNTAQDNATTHTGTNSSHHTDVPDGEGILSFVPGMKSSSDAEARFKGDGKTARNGSMNAVISARVIQVLANGNVVIEGAKDVVINDETETIKITGTARPEDISADNLVYSSRLSQASISYAGQGSVSSAQSKGVLARLLDWLF